MYERMERIKLGALATSEAMFASDRKKNSLGLDTKSFANRARRSEQKRKSDTVVRLSRVFISNHACSIEYAHRINTECVTVQEMSSSSSSSNSSGASGLSGFQKNAAVFEIGDLSLQALSAPALEFARASSSATDFGFGEEGDRYSAMNGSSTTEKRGTETVAKTTISDAMTFIKEQEREQKIASGEIVAPQRTEGGFFGLLADSFEKLLFQIQDIERAVGIPYPVGNSIIILTALVKLVTFPLTKSQVVSAMNMKNLQPQVKALKEKYEDDPERMNAEINRIYEDNAVNPLAGCGPLILTLPVFIGLYRAFKNAGIDGGFDESWLFIPNLSGPSEEQDISWLWPLDDSFNPPLDGGWEAAWPYLVMPILTTLTQFYSMNVMQPSADEQTKEMKNQSVLIQFLPFFIGYISLTVPAGLAMYWLFNNIFTTATQVYLRNFGGAQATVEAPDEITIKIPLGCALVEDHFERVPKDEVETYLKTNPSVIWDEVWLENWRKEQAKEILSSIENAETELMDMGASAEAAALYAERLRRRAKRYKDIRKRKNATSQEIRDLIVEYEQEGKEGVEDLKKALIATLKFEDELKRENLNLITDAKTGSSNEA